MKNVLKAFGLIALVAVIGFSMVACDADDSGGGINGTWGDNGYTFRISGSEGYFTAIYSGAWSYTSVRVGDRKFRDIRRTGNNEWKAEELCYNNSTYYTLWLNCTLSLSSDGQTLTVYNANTSTRYNYYYRR